MRPRAARPRARALPSRNTRRVDTRLAAVSETAAAAPPADRTFSTFPVFLFAALGLSIVLLGVAAVPPWAVRADRVAGLLGQWRVEIAGAGLSMLLGAVVVLLIRSSL